MLILYNPLSSTFNRPEPSGDDRVDDVALSPNEVVEFECFLEETIVSHATDLSCSFHEPIGNIHEQPLAAILNSGEVVTFRRRLDINADLICRKGIFGLNLRPAATL